MFRIECFVDEKQVGEVLKRLTGLARDVKYQYVANVEPRKNGKMQVIAGSRIELIQKEIHKRKLTKITGPEARTLMTKIGLNELSYSHFLNEMVRAGMLKKGDKVKGDNTSARNVMTYIVTGK